MATIKKQGRGYKITVSRGYDIHGKQLREHMTWIPDPGMTARQIEKELNRQAVLFEEHILSAGVHDGGTRFAEFAEIFLRDYARPNLKAQTVYGYEERIQRINKAIGHIRLKDLRPQHLAAFYANLQEDGMRVKELATATFDLAAWLRENDTTLVEIHRNYGISMWALKRTKARKSIAPESAGKIADVIGRDRKDLFTIERDMTPLSVGTIQTYHRTISAVLHRAVKWGYIRDNPADRVDTPGTARKEAAYLDEPDVRRLLELLAKEPIKWRTLITFDLLSGIRRGELAGLRWSDIDFDNGVIHIRQTYNYIPTKGAYIDTPKSAKSARSIRVSKSAILLLSEYRSWQDHQRAILGDAWEGVDDRVFTNDFGAPIFPTSITQWFSKFVARTGLPRVSVHSLRHTCASLMISEGVPLVVVSKQLGHAQTSTTTNIYTHVIQAAEARAAQTFDRFDDVIFASKHQISTNEDNKVSAG